MICPWSTIDSYYPGNNQHSNFISMMTLLQAAAVQQYGSSTQQCCRTRQRVHLSPRVHLSLLQTRNACKPNVRIPDRIWRGTTIMLPYSLLLLCIPPPLLHLILQTIIVLRVQVYSSQYSSTAAFSLIILIKIGSLENKARTRLII